MSGEKAADPVILYGPNGEVISSKNPIPVKESVEPLVYEEGVGVIIPGQGTAAAYSVIELISVALKYTTNAEAGSRNCEVGLFRNGKTSESMLFDSVKFTEISKGYYFQWNSNGVSAYMGGETSIGQPFAELRPLPMKIVVNEGWTVGITVEGKKATDIYIPRILWRPVIV